MEEFLLVDIEAQLIRLVWSIRLAACLVPASIILGSMFISYAIEKIGRSDE